MTDTPDAADKFDDMAEAYFDSVSDPAIVGELADVFRNCFRDGQRRAYERAIEIYKDCIVSDHPIMRLEDALRAELAALEGEKP